MYIYKCGITIYEILCVTGSFKVFDTDWKELANFHHRKEEISDIKFSPSNFPFPKILYSLKILCCPS